MYVCVCMAVVEFGWCRGNGMRWVNGTFSHSTNFQHFILFFFLFVLSKISLGKCFAWNKLDKHLFNFLKLFYVTQVIFSGMNELLICEKFLGNFSFSHFSQLIILFRNQFFYARNCIIKWQTFNTFFSYFLSQLIKE